jgi:tight adherence protein B
MILAALCVGVAVTLLMMTVYITERRQADVQVMNALSQRLKKVLGAGADGFETESASSFADAWKNYAEHVAMLREAAHWLKVARIPWGPKSFALITLGLAGFVAIMLLTVGTKLEIAAGIGAAILFLPVLHIQRVRQGYMKKFGELLPTAVGGLANALDVGHSVESSLVHVGHHSPYPMCDELMTIHNELKFGASLADAMKHLSSRIDTAETRFFCVCLAVQQKSGGNLSEILKNLETTIRDQFAIRREAKAMMAEGRMTLMVLSVLPWALFTFQYFGNRATTLAFIHDPKGQMFIGVAVALHLIGIFWAARIMNLENIK